MLEYITARCITNPSLFAAASHSFYLTHKGKLYACGDNENGQTGLGFFTSVTLSWKHVNIPEAVQTIATCSQYTLVLTVTGKVYGMGDYTVRTDNDHYYELGYNPVLIPFSRPVKTIGIAADTASFFVMDNGEVRCKETKPSPICDIEQERVIRIITATIYTLFITSTGRVLALYHFRGADVIHSLPLWATREEILSTDGDVYKYHLITGLSNNEPINRNIGKLAADGKGAILMLEGTLHDIACGDNHILVIHNGCIGVKGANEKGQLGLEREKFVYSHVNPVKEGKCCIM